MKKIVILIATILAISTAALAGCSDNKTGSATITEPESNQISVQNDNAEITEQTALREFDGEDGEYDDGDCRDGDCEDGEHDDGEKRRHGRRNHRKPNVKHNGRRRGHGPSPRPMPRMAE